MVTGHWSASGWRAILASMQPAAAHPICPFGPAPDPVVVDRYGPLLARLYEPLGTLYSGGAIAACRSWGVIHLVPGSRVLFAGAGAATEAVAAARRRVGCELVDNSPAMLQRAQTTLDPLELSGCIDYRLADVQDLSPATYDAVVAHFFLNTFDTESMRQIFAVLLGLLRPAGLLVVGDFAGPATGRWQRRYHDLPMQLFARWTGSQPHPIHDIPQTGADLGAQLVETRSFRLARLGPAWYASWVFTK